MSDVENKEGSDDRSASVSYSSYESETSDSYSSNSYSDISEEDDDEWQGEVSPNGDLFYVQPSNLAGHRLQSKAKPNRTVQQVAKSPPPSPPVDGVGRKGRTEEQQQHRADDNDRTRTKIEVILTLNTKRSTLGRRHRFASLEHALGIVPGRFGDVVTVKAIVPGNEAISASGVQIGDWIQKLNETDVTWTNFDRVTLALVSSQAKRVKLTLSSPSDDSGRNQSQTSSDISCRKTELFFPKLLYGSDDKWKMLMNYMSMQPHVVLYLTLGSSESSDLNEDVVFQFPVGLNKLFSIRGALFTISHVLPDIAGSQPISSTLLVGSELLHVGYAREGNEVLLVALPGKCVTTYQLTAMTCDMVRTLLFQYKTLHDAFTNKSHHGSLDHFFTVLFLNCIAQERLHSPPPFEDLPFYKFFGTPQFLPLSPDLRDSIDATLSELESADFADLSEDYYDMRRLYNILGTTLFFKGYVVANHLPSEDLLDIYLYLDGNGLLDASRSAALGQVVIWREVFPRGRQDEQLDRRWFLLVVGRSHCFLAVMLEAGGCSAKVVGPQGPDPFYVNQSQSVLIQLEVMQVPKSLETWLDCPVAPALESVEMAACYQDGKIKRRSSLKVTDKLTDQKAAKGLSSSKLSLGSLSSWHHVQTESNAGSPKKEALERVLGDTDSDSTSLSLTASGTSDDTTPILRRRGHQDPDCRPSWSDVESHDDAENKFTKPFQAGASRRNLPSMLDLAAVGESLPSLARDRNFALPKLTSGPHNILFHYVHLDCAEGVLICPTKNLSCGEDVHSQVLQNFISASLLVQQTLRFQNTMPQENTLGGKNGSLYVEHGLLLTIPNSFEECVSHRRGSKSLSYWVIGRLFTQPCHREVYVCHQDLFPQSVIELAFQLAFGVSV